MKTFPAKRVTIVAESSLEDEIVKDIHDFGATGSTFSVVHGEGQKGARPSTWAGPNARIEVVTTPEIAEKILDHVEQKYFEKYAVIAYLDDVQVIRPEKFGIHV